MAEATSTKAFRNWMYSTSFEDIPPDVRQLTVLALYDGIGGNLACSLLPVAHRMVDFVKVVGGSPDCSMIGFPLRTSVLNAALVNGTVGHADELDAGESDRQGAHIQAAVIAAALAAGQLAGASGEVVVRAVVLGYELSKRVQRVAAQVSQGDGRAIDEGNTLGAVAAAGLALGLLPDRMDVALSLAANMACGFTPLQDVALSLAANMASGFTPSQNETEHMAKSFVRGGLGAKNGVAAALMAKVGYDAPRDVFDGPHGFFHRRLGVKEPGPEFLRGLGQEYSIRGLNFKGQCAAGGLLAPRQGLLELMSENGLAADNIREIQVEVHPSRIDNIPIDSIPNVHYPSIYGREVLALAAVYGGVGFREAHQESCYRSPQVLSMRERIKIQAGRDWTGREHRFHALVTVTTKDGRRLHKEADHRRMTEEDLDDKFSSVVGLRAGEAKAKELAGVLKRLDTVSNVADVMVRLELPEARIDQV